MRIFEKEKRLNHSFATIDYFMNNEFNYYSLNNVYEFQYDNKNYKSLYKRLNIQLLITKKCPFNCKFCIEKINPVGNEDRNEELCLENLEKVIQTLKQNNMMPTISITGGEPMLYVEYVSKVINLCKKFNVPFNINTSGILTEQAKELYKKVDRINLSVHNYDNEKNSEIFGCKRDSYWQNENFKNATIQTVLLNVDFNYLIKFLNSFKQKRISIRFPSDTNEMPSIEWYKLFENIKNCNDFEFIQQKIGDYYWYEEYRYKDKILRFSFSSLKQLEYYKNNKEDKNSPFVRAVIITPNGNVNFDWII